MEGKPKNMRAKKGITLIALIITIIVLLILAGITISFTIGERGIFQLAQQANLQTKQQQAREKLELVLLDLQADKLIDSTYNETEYINKKIRENGMVVDDDIVIVDDYRFQLDRSVPKIGISLGKEKAIAIIVPYIGTSSFTIKLSYIYNKDEIAKYTYIIDDEEIMKLEDEYTKEGLEPESNHRVKVIAEYKNGEILESNVITIKTDNRTYLIKDGKNTGVIEWENHPVTDGYQTVIQPEQKDEYIYFIANGNESTICGYVSANKIDLTPYKKICLDAKKNIDAPSGAAQLCIAENKITYPNFVNRIWINASEGRKVWELNVEDLKEQYYLSTMVLVSKRLYRQKYVPI